jgi:O-antigen/teichoic acid export membrane protein
LNPLKKLAGQTAIYGLGTIVPRFLNYLLVPLYTHGLLNEVEYGVVTELQAYIAFFFVIVLGGMETSFFRYAEKEGNPQRVFTTAFLGNLFIAFLFLLFVISLIKPISDFLKYSQNKDYIIYAALIVAIDSFTAIQFAYLRQQNKALRFSALKILSVIINVTLNLYFIWFCDHLYKTNPGSPLLVFYNPSFKVGYVFISALISSGITLLLLSPQIIKAKLVVDFPLLKQIFIYAFPLLIVAIAGMINEVSDKIVFKYLATVPEGITDANGYVMQQLGIYGANFKLAVLMTLFIQMFRYAAEPFFFSHAKESNATKIYADVLKYFVILGLIIFLVVLLYIDVFKYFIGKDYWEGLKIVPVVLMANLFLGVFFNLSFWYKLNDLTRYGAYIAIIGSVITIALNILLVPKYSYSGAAWGRFIAYTVMMWLSYYWGKRFYPVEYEWKKIFFYGFAALSVYAISTLVHIQSIPYKILFNSLLFLLFLVMIFYHEKRLFMKPTK